MGRDISGVNRFFEPGDIEFLKMPRPADRLVEREALIGIRHDVPGIAHRRPYGAQPARILRDMRTTDLDLGAAEATLLGLYRFVDKLLVVDVKPATFGVVELDAILGAARDLVQRQFGALGAQVP